MIYIAVPALVDTNVLVYRFDPRFPDKQQRARELLRQGIEEDNIRIPHQALIEFVAATTRPLTRGSTQRLLSTGEAQREIEEMLAQFSVLFPDEEVVRLALRGSASYQLPWFDAHLWAYAERFSLDTIWSEDFAHNRLYGRVRTKNPFL